MDESDAAKAQAEAAEAAKGKTTARAAAQERTAAGIVTDLIVARPTALMATIAGSAYFVLTLPITAPTGQYDEALDRFVKEPADRLTAPVAE